MVFFRYPHPCASSSCGYNNDGERYSRINLNDIMKHYVCTGECGGESENPGVCQDETCSRHSEPLMACSCGDGLHKEVLAHAKGEDMLEDDIGADEEDEL